MAIYEHTLKNAYIGEYVEETYHINASSNLNVYKSWNIINSIVLSWTETWANNQSSEDVHRITVADSTGTYQNWIQLYCSFPSKYGTNVYFQIIKLQNASTTILYTSPYWYTWQLVAAEYELTITRTWWDLRVGTNTASWTFDSSMESIIETLFNWSSVYVIHKKYYWYSTWVDAKVIYWTA